MARKAHPLGPLIERVPCRHGTRSQIYAIVVAVTCLGILGVAVYLDPNPDGRGTHRQLGFGPCGMMVMTGLPCPTCGMTTSFAHGVRGQLLAAFWAQPMGMVLFGLTAVLAVASIAVAVTGRTWRINWYRISPNTVILVVAVLWIASWGFKIAVTLLDDARSLG